MNDNLSVTHVHGAVSYRLAFTWLVWETLASEWGDEWQNRLGALLSGNPRDLRYVTELVTDGAFDGSVMLPVLPLTNALYRAYELAWSGVDINETKPEAKADGKKPRGWSQFFRLTDPRG